MTENEIEKITLIVKNRKGLSKAIRHITGIVERNFISGSCSAWECEMQTLEDYRNEVIDEFAEKIFEYCSMSDMNRKMIKQIAEQMKAGGVE